jgi:hypothetical protein
VTTATVDAGSLWNKRSSNLTSIKNKLIFLSMMKKTGGATEEVVEEESGITSRKTST